MYDSFSTNYDRFVDWDGRLTAELPFIEQQLQEVDARRILDVACGTGMHAIALAQKGYEVVGTDLSVEMIEQARINAARAEADVRFQVASFNELTQVLCNNAPQSEAFDAILCLGNSLPHLLTRKALAAALDNVATCLRSGGLLLNQNRNFDAVLTRRERWMDLQAYQEEQDEWLFLRFYDFDPDGKLTFNVVTLRREGPEAWSQQIMSTRLWPQTREELTEALQAAQFANITYYGDMEGHPFEAKVSPNLVITARAP